MIGLFLLTLTLRASSTVLAHSWAECTDYDAPSFDYRTLGNFNHDRCKGYPRGFARQYEAGFGIDTGFDYRERDCARFPYNPDDYSDTIPMATFSPDQRFIMSHPAKNHAADVCTNAFIPSTSFVIRMSSEAEVDTFDVELQVEGGEHVNGEIDHLGFQRCFDFCADTDKSHCLAAWTIPQDTSEGRHSFMWEWEFNIGEFYITCFDAMIVNGGTTGSATNETTVSPSPSPTEDNETITFPSTTPAPSNTPASTTLAPSSTPASTTPAPSTPSSVASGSGGSSISEPPNVDTNSVSNSGTVALASIGGVLTITGVVNITITQQHAKKMRVEPKNVDLSIPEGQLEVIFHYGAYPLWRFLQEVIGINIVEVCPRVTKEEPILDTPNGKLVVRVVDLPYRSEIGHMHNNDMIFLINSINVVFQSLQGGVERDGQRLLESFKFTLDSDKNMVMVGTDTDIPISEKALAIIKIE